MSPACLVVSLCGWEASIHRQKTLSLRAFRFDLMRDRMRRTA